MAPDPKPPVIEYSRPGHDKRVSRLAVASMFISLFSCPCVWGTVVATFSQYVVRLNGFVTMAAGWAGLVVPPVLALIALARIRRSNRNLDGADYVYFALTFSSIWIIFVVGGNWLTKYF
jgi:hypothetical protein